MQEGVGDSDRFDPFHLVQPIGVVDANPIEHIDPTSFNAVPIIDQMGKMAFQARNLSRACKIVDKMMHKAPEKRYQDVDSLLEDLARVQVLATA